MRRRRKKEWGKKQRVCQVLFVLSNPPPPTPFFSGQVPCARKTPCFLFSHPFCVNFAQENNTRPVCELSRFFFFSPLSCNPIFLLLIRAIFPLF